MLSSLCLYLSLAHKDKRGIRGYEVIKGPSNEALQAAQEALASQVLDAPENAEVPHDLTFTVITWENSHKKSPMTIVIATTLVVQSPLGWLISGYLKDSDVSSKSVLELVIFDPEKPAGLWLRGEFNPGEEVTPVIEENQIISIERREI